MVFFFQIGLLDNALHYNSWIHFYEFDVFKKQPNYRRDLIIQLMTSKKEAYKLVRNPYKRAVSSFVMFNEVFPMHWGDLGAHMKQKFYQNSNSSKGLSFKQFLQYLKSNIHLVDGHFAPQYVAGEERYVNKYIYLENYETSIRKLEKQYRLKAAPLDQLSQSDHHFRQRMTHIGNYADVPTTDPLFPNLPTFESFYNEETKLLVEEIYKKDFEIYSYNKSL